MSDRLCPTGGYDAGQGVCDNAFGWKSLGQELRPNDVTTDLTAFQHGNRALAAKDMRKSQGEHQDGVGVQCCAEVLGSGTG